MSKFDRCADEVWQQLLFFSAEKENELYYANEKYTVDIDLNSNYSDSPNLYLINKNFRLPRKLGYIHNFN